MRGKVVYGYPSESGDLLTWFGCDLEFGGKHEKWVAGGKVEKEPEKFHFVKGFHRGLELFGQHAVRSPEAAERLKALGLVVVEGSNDAIRLDTLNIPAVALCSNRISREQAAKAAGLARELAGGIVTVFLDCDPEGEEGIKRRLGYLAQLVPARLAWPSKMYGGKFKGLQPESPRSDESQEIDTFPAEWRDERLDAGVSGRPCRCHRDAEHRLVLRPANQEAYDLGAVRNGHRSASTRRGGQVFAQVLAKCVNRNDVYGIDQHRFPEWTV